MLSPVFLVPHLACRPLEHYPESKIYQECRHFQEYAHNVTNQTVGYLRDHTYDRGVRNLQQVYGSALDVKNSLVDSVDDAYQNMKKSVRRSVDRVENYFTDVVDTTKDNAKEYCDAGLQKVNALVDEVKRERQKILGNGHALKPDQEQELQIVSECSQIGISFIALLFSSSSFEISWTNTLRMKQDKPITLSRRTVNT